MSEKEHLCGNCYWWDVTEGWMHDGFHECHNKKAAEDNNYPTLHTVRDEFCTHHRPISPDDPATTWNRRSPGRKTKSPRAAKDPAAVKRGKSSKRKGARREKELGDRVEKRVGGEAIVRHGDRDVQFVGNGLENHQVEVKGRKAFAFIKHCKQAALDAAHHGLPRWVVACKADREPWYAIVDMDDYLDDIQELYERRGKDVGEAA